MPYIAGAIIGGSVLSGAFAKNQQTSAQKFTTRQMKNRHQWETSDLEKAGLNRILGYTKGGPPTGGSPVASTPDFGGSAAQAMRQKAEINRINAETALTHKKADAIGPASAIGGGIENLYNWLEEQAGTTGRALQRQIDQYLQHKSDITHPKQYDFSKTKGPIKSIKLVK